MKSKMCSGDEFDTFEYMLKLCPKWNNKKLSRDVGAARAVPRYEIQWAIPEKYRLRLFKKPK